MPKVKVQNPELYYDVIISCRTRLHLLSMFNISVFEEEVIFNPWPLSVEQPFQHNKAWG